MSSFFRKELEKPDGRALYLYSRRPIPDGIVATSPSKERVAANPQLRWQPLRGEWVSYASHRQHRTFLPPKEFNPLAPTRRGGHETELPSGDYDAAVFENLFPSLSLGAHDPPELFVPTAPGKGICEVVVFTQSAETSLGALPLDHVELLVHVWADRYKALSQVPGLEYALMFENRGVEVGVTLHHPHGQIYAYSFVPPVPARQLKQEEEHFATHQRGLLEQLIENELRDRARLIHEESTALAFVPICARYSYEVWIAPKRRVASIAELKELEIRDFARTLKTVLLKYDGLWNRPFPYLMVFYQAPFRGDHPETHFHIEFFPPYRSQGKLKFLAGTEIGAGMFASDSIPEVKAKELQAVRVTLE